MKRKGIDIIEFGLMPEAQQREYIKTLGTEKAKRVPEPQRTKLKQALARLSKITDEIWKMGGVSEPTPLEAPTYASPDNVRSAVQTGELTKEEGAAILRQRWPELFE